MSETTPKQKKDESDELLSETTPNERSMKRTIYSPNPPLINGSMAL